MEKIKIWQLLLLFLGLNKTFIVDSLLCIILLLCQQQDTK